jgi:predicted nucleic acid-binding protein
MIYLDTSAALKLVLPEPETEVLEQWIAERIAALENLLPLAPHAAPLAEVIGNAALRSLDAIHLVTAHGLRDGLTAFVCYDGRLCASAKAAGLPVESPS